MCIKVQCKQNNVMKSVWGQHLQECCSEREYELRRLIKKWCRKMCVKRGTERDDLLQKVCRKREALRDVCLFVLLHFPVSASSMMTALLCCINLNSTRILILTSQGSSPVLLSVPHTSVATAWLWAVCFMADSKQMLRVRLSGAGQPAAYFPWCSAESFAKWILITLL